MENEIVKALNFFYHSNNIKAYAYRFPQSERKMQKGVSNQPCDILSDSSNSKYYIAIEAKSMDISDKNQNLNFKSRFTCTNNIHQLEHESFFCELTGRTGWLVIELRRGAGKPRKCHVIDLNSVCHKYKAGEKSLKLVEILTSPEINRVGGKYVVGEELFLPRLIT
jgi:hypothetical protein